MLVKNITHNTCQELLDNRKNQDDIVANDNAATSFDGSCSSRWWSSTTGCMAVIARETEKILDVAMLCNHCDECEVWINKREITEADALQSMDWSIKRFSSC